MGDQATQLRHELRELVHTHVPEDYLGAFTDDPADLEVAQRFCRLLADSGLLCLAWPEEFGGRGASAWEQTAVREEMWAHHEPRGAQYMGVNWVGPAIMRHGTPEQQRAHLPPIARGEVIWCQGFSEPDAGSDLASLRTAASRDGDGWRITGQKIWTSYATMAQWCFLLARTSRGEKKQQGLTVFLVPDVRPGHRGPAHPVHARAAPPQRGLLRRPPGHRGRRARHGGRRLAGRAGGAGLRAGGHRPLRPLRAAAADRAGGAAATPGTTCRPSCAAAGPGCSPTAGGPGCWPTGSCPCRASGQVTPGDTAAYRIAVTKLDQDSAEVLMEIVALARARPTPTTARFAGRSRTTGATRRPPPSRRAASRCSASCWPALLPEAARA